MTDKQALGAKGEDAAAAYLERAGLHLVERNWRCQLGEIDIVAIDGETLVLCEVKTRRTRRTGRPEEAVGPAKQRKLKRLADAYLAQAGDLACPVRFDVVAIDVLGEDRALLRHHRCAFTVSG